MEFSCYKSVAPFGLESLLAISCRRIVAFEGGEVGQSMHWHRMRHEDDVSIMVSGSPDFGERRTRGEVRRVEVSNRQQTDYSGHHEKAPVGRGGGDRTVVVRDRDERETVGQLRLALRESRCEEEELNPSGRNYFHLVGRDSEPKRSRNSAQNNEPHRRSKGFIMH